MLLADSCWQMAICYCLYKRPAPCGGAGHPCYEWAGVVFLLRNSYLRLYSEVNANIGDLFERWRLSTRRLSRLKIVWSMAILLLFSMAMGVILARLGLIGSTN